MRIAAAACESGRRSRPSGGNARIRGENRFRVATHGVVGRATPWLVAAAAVVGRTARLRSSPTAAPISAAPRRSNRPNGRAEARPQKARKRPLKRRQNSRATPEKLASNAGKTHEQRRQATPFPTGNTYPPTRPTTLRSRPRARQRYSPGARAPDNATVPVPTRPTTLQSQCPRARQRYSPGAHAPCDRRRPPAAEKLKPAPSATCRSTFPA